jgi:hypothetical protein
MQFHRPLALVLPLLLISGCEPLNEEPQQFEPTELGYTSLDSLPAEYGQLVAVTRAFSPEWYELWLSEPASGRITLVPVWRPGLSYQKSFVTVIERAPADTAQVTPQSAP